MSRKSLANATEVVGKCHRSCKHCNGRGGCTTHSKKSLVIARFVDNVGDDAPHMERVGGFDFYPWEVGIGGDKEAMVTVSLNAFDGVFTVELTDGNIPSHWIFVVFVDDEDIAGMDVGVYHRFTFDTYHIG